MRRIVHCLLVLAAGTAPLFPQSGAAIRLTLQQAEGMALRDHPQVQAEQSVSGALTYCRGRAMPRTRAKRFVWQVPLPHGSSDSHGRPRDAWASAPLRFLFRA